MAYIPVSSIGPYIFSSVDPTVNDDITRGFIVGRRWLNLTNATQWICFDTTEGAAVWVVVGNTTSYLKSTTPTTTDDHSSGYHVGDRWLNLTTADEWICMDNTTDAAVWVQGTHLIYRTTTDPTISDDITDGFSIGDIWMNLVDAKEYRCWVNDEGAAVWLQVGTVTGPSSSTNTAIPKFSGTTGRILDNSTITIDGSGNLNIGSAKIVSLADGVASSDAVTKGQLDQAIQGLDWQDSVISKSSSTPPVSPSNGDRYIVDSGASGAWSGHVASIAEYNGSSWTFTSSNEGFAVWVEDVNSLYVYNGSSWVTFGSTSAHSSLSGLTSGDDHTQYAKIAGRSGGQTFYGGTGAGDNLVLSASSDGSPGNVSISRALFSDLTASTVPYLDTSKVLTSSSVTTTELGYVSGVTSSIQTQLDGKVVLAGVSGGQSIIGGTGASENLTLTSTSHGTKGAITMASKVNFQSYTPYFTMYDNGNSGDSKTIDWGNGIKQKITLTPTTNCVISFTAPPGPAGLTLEVYQNASGSKTVTWPATVFWPGGLAPTLTTTAGAMDVISIHYNGTNYVATSALDMRAS